MKSAFDYSGPSTIVARDSSFLATRTESKKHGGPKSLTGLSRSSDDRIAAQRAAILNENKATPWQHMPVIGAERSRTENDQRAALIGKRNDRRSQ